MRTLDALRVPVGDGQRAAAFFGGVFGWQFRPGTGQEVVAVQEDPAGELTPSAGLVFSARDRCPGGSTVLCLSGSGPAVTTTDPDGTPLRVGGRGPMAPEPTAGPTAGPSRAHESRGVLGVLGVVFVYVRDLEETARFYRELCGWSFTAVGRDRDILFVSSGPPVGLRPIEKKPGGQAGTVGFHLSVRDSGLVAEAIRARGGHTGDPQGAGAFTIQPCFDDQGTPFALWSES